MTVAAYEWNGQAFLPLPHFKAKCEAELVVGEVYRLEAVPEISKKERGFYHACLSNAWKNLPEDIAPSYPTTESLRKRALLAAGFSTKIEKEFATERDAINAAALAAPLDEYTYIKVTGKTVLVVTPESQSEATMGAERWRLSKDRVLDVVSRLIGVDVTTLKSQVAPAREYSPQDQV